MKQYRIVFGAYVRMYADHIIHAENNEAARKLAIEECRIRSHELQWLDPNYDNLALPSIVSMQTDDPPCDVLEGYDFPITPADARHMRPTQCSQRLNSSAWLLPIARHRNARAITRNAPKSLPKRSRKRPLFNKHKTRRHCHNPT
jgi:hypothetical protein